jgi:hypothetical protein
MSDKKATEGETPEVPAEKVEKVEPVVSEKPATEPEEFDQERAMTTIRTLREIEKQAKKDAKELELLRAKEREREEAEMTELEKARKQVEELNAEKAKLQTDIWKQQAAAEANLPSIFAERVKGSTLDEMKADALALAEALPKSKNTPSLKATNPANGEKKETDAETRARLFGTPQNAFTMDMIKQQGGGVVWHEEEG